MKERFSITDLNKVVLKMTRRPGMDQSRESADRDRALAERAVAIEKLKRLRMKTP
ncbi:MAG TPA: hypothetical protein VFE34_09700 [Dongiaceae bacterium]|jgi:hypothetical protein|nr:hypothetical protein [Dongiaceae bacterium]